MNKKTSIEEKFEAFSKANRLENKKDDICFIGLNFIDKPENAITFKAYCNMTKEAESRFGFLKVLREKKMIHALNVIDDNINMGKLRVDIGLHNRNNTNMQWLYDYLYHKFPYITKYNDIVKKLNEIEGSLLEDYKYSAMYFLGLIADIDEDKSFELAAVKLHYLLRTLDDPNNLKAGYELTPKKYIDTLRKTQIPQFLELTDLIDELDEVCNFELWIAAVDFYETKSNKYKIYIKNINTDVLKALQNAFEKRGKKDLKIWFDSYIDWLNNHNELSCYGIALCIADDGKWSVNLYH